MIRTAKPTAGPKITANVSQNSTRFMVNLLGRSVAEKVSECANG